ncbi:hypothetical protein [Limnovirga soli]|uniref:Uncharacterized protein n=1 Tax=Limnovirga soli TaxID=2656915 RepID=A0A8J8FG76_9BACT|nr:hypothetical protein [Limnovirga soli]NNV54519.1 hypothetical protein [Limnovirga soli]
MARTVDEIKQLITDTYVANMATIGYEINPTTWSKVNLQRNFIYVVAFCMFALETLFDILVSDTDTKLQEKNILNKYGYRDLLLNFQYGFPTKFESSEFDNTGYTDAEIADSKVIKHAAVIKQINAYGRVLLKFKVAGSTDGTDRVELDPEIIAALTAYLDMAAYAGDHWEVTTGPADKIKTKFKIKYDPLLITPTGDRIGGEALVIRNAAKSFLVDGMKFANTYVPTYHTDWMQAVKGVTDAQMISCSATYGLLDYTVVNDKYVPDAGYLKYYDDTDLEIELVPNDIE